MTSPAPTVLRLLLFACAAALSGCEEKSLESPVIRPVLTMVVQPAS